ELKCEIRGLRPVASAIDQLRLLRAQTPKTVLLSDTYFSDSVLHQMLEHCGIDCAEEQLFCSSMHDATKRDGALFDIAAAQLGARRSEITHLGDNAYSDVLRPRQLGLTGLLFEGGAASR